MSKLGVLFFIMALCQTQLWAQVMGCTDTQASNYESSANINDGSCVYAETTIDPVVSIALPDAVAETSGLIFWNNQLITHNDNTDTNLYGLNTVTGEILKTYPLDDLTNKDWEEIAQDEEYIYIGDFGNNGNGNRKNLRIFKIDKASLKSGSPDVTQINFSYPEQTDFSDTGNNNTDFDCEAFVVTDDQIYLFTKQWVSLRTALYTIPKTAGTYSASLVTTYNVDGLITGSTSILEKNLIVLSGYSNSLEPFVYLLYDFPQHEFFNGNKRKIMLSLPLHQTEAITTTDGLEYFITNESLVKQPYVNNPQKLHDFSLKPFLEDYLQTYTLATSKAATSPEIVVYPNPVNGDTLNITYSKSLVSHYFKITNSTGQEVMKGTLKKDKSLNISSLESGIYYLLIDGKSKTSFKVIKS
ncbi:MAG: T9SS type A sorting domain-containing protein [Leeuwenhoekiella sp.]